MQILLAVGVTLLTATLPQAQVSLAPAPPISVTFVDASFEDAVSFIAKYGKLTIEIDQSVSQELRKEPIAGAPIKMRDVTIEEALRALTARNGLDYSIVNATMVRIYKKV
jgi:hypothetical protein